MTIKYLEGILVFFFFFTKILLFNLYPINYEYTFVEAAKYFQTYDKNILYDYSKIQSNTLAFSFLIYFFSKLFFIENLYIVGKLISASSYFILYFAFKNFSKLFNYKNYIFLLIILFLNPLVWIYTSRISVDIFPVSMIMLSVSFFLTNIINKKKLLLSAFFFLIGTILKPNLLALIILPILLLFFNGKKIKKNIFDGCLFVLINISGLIFYYFYSIKIFGFFISPTNNLYSFSGFFFVLNNFIIYTGILCLFSMPFMLHNFREKLTLQNTVLIIVIFLISYFGVSDKTLFGEVDLGKFNLFSNKILKALYLSLPVLLIVNLIDILKKIDNKKKKYFLIIIFSIFIYIFVLSFFRPAQRYLIPAMLLIYVFLFDHIKSKKIIITAALLFVFLNFYSTVESANRSFIAKKTLTYLSDNNLLNITNLGVVTDSFKGIKTHIENNQKIKYLLKSSGKNCIKFFENKILFSKKEYCLMENDQ